MPCKSVRSCILTGLLLVGVAGYPQDQLVTKKLDSLKRRDNLIEWLYTRIDHVTTYPQQLSFLMATQKQVWRQPRNMQEHLAWLTLLSSQGYDQLQAGDILASINCYEQAYAYDQQHKVPQFDLVEYVLKPLGNNYTRLGDNDRALYIQQKSVEDLNAFDNADDIASIFSNMAITCYTMGNYRDALKYIDKGLAIAKEHEVYYRLQNTLANVLYEQGDLTRAKAVLKKVIEEQKPGTKTYESLYNAYNTLGNIALKDSVLIEAKKNFGTALKMLNTEWLIGELPRERAATITQLGKIARLQHQPQQALQLLDSALRVLKVHTKDPKSIGKQIYGEIDLVDIFREKALTYIGMEQCVPALENLYHALSTTDKIRAEFADDKTRERLQADSRDLTEMAMAQAFIIANAWYTDKSKLLPILELSEQSKARTLADQLLKNRRLANAKSTDTVFKKQMDLERAIAYDQRMLMTGGDGIAYQKKIDALKFELALFNKQHGQKDVASVLPVNELLKALPAGQQVFEYFFGKDQLYIISIKNQKVDQVTAVGAASTVKNDVEKLIGYYRNGPDAMLNAPKEFYHQSYWVWSTLMNYTTFKNNEHICIVPDGVLGYLSFDGLVTKEKYEPAISKWPFLVRQATISYAFSLNTLVSSKDKANTGDGFSGLFVTHNKVNDKPILAVRKEAEAVREVVQGNYLYDDEVNTKAFFKAFEHSSVMHISTHAYLSGTGQQPTLDLGKDKLYLFELLATRQQPQLVILGACRTGDGLLAEGEGVISLARGFSAIGTQATIAGLWNVNDEAASQITADVYAGLVKGQSSGAALHQAKLHWLDNDQANDALYLPYYWDSLILVGADEPAQLNKADKRWYGLAIDALLLVLTAILWKIQKPEQT